MRAFVIINPTAGGGLALAAIEARLADRLGATVRRTERVGHAEALAAEARRSGFDRVVAVGGDGTVGEVVNGLVSCSTGTPNMPRPTLGIIPLGTGNDLARALGIPGRPEAAIEIVARGRTRPLDLIEAFSDGRFGRERRLIANAAVAGFCGRIGDRMSPSFRRRWRRFAYPVAAVRELSDLRRHAVRIDVDDRTVELDAFMVIVANSRFAGGHIPLAPPARTDDGALDVVVIESCTPVRFPGLAARVLRGTHVGRPGARHFAATRVELTSEPPMWMNIDGDSWQASRTTFRVLPSELLVTAP